MFARFFVDRPVGSTVISLVIVIVGLVALTKLPIAQYPEIAPPTITVTAAYPGASAKTVADTVAAPIEQEVNGVEKMIYMSSRCTNDGQMTLDVTFKLGTNLDMAQVLVQNRVSIAEAKLPDEVKRQGVTTKKKSPSILLCVNLISEMEKDSSTGAGKYKYDQLYLSNYATTQIKDALSRLEGVGDVQFLGPRDYSMRIWLDPSKLASRSMTAGDVTSAISKQNRQVAAGRLGQPPTPKGVNFQYPLNALGRLETEDQFRNIVVKTGEDGSLTYLKDIVIDARKDQKGIELGAKNYDVNSYLDSEPSITLAIFQLPGSNALETADHIKKTMKELEGSFPNGMSYKIVYDTTVFIDESVHEVYKTLFEAFVLVFIVVLIFLQDWRATLMPMIDVPVSLIGTFAVMAALGFSLNNLSLLGLVLAIGIVVDDAIVVVENVERWMAKGLPPREATIKAMEEITGPVIAITLVLSSVFVPTAFMAGITGQFFKQFALTIATATIISAINAMTMAPARAVTLIKPHKPGHEGHREALPPLGWALVGGLIAFWKAAPLVAGYFAVAAEHGHESTHDPHAVATLWGVRLGVFAVGAVIGLLLSKPLNFVFGRFFVVFNRAFDRISKGYGEVVRGVLRVSVIMLVVYGGLIGLTVYGFQVVPAGFIPQQDKGYLVVNAQLPDGASLERTDAVVQRMTKIARADEGVGHVIGVPGYSILTSTNIPNSGGMFVVLKPFEKRAGKSALSADAVMARLRAAFYDQVLEAQVGIFGAPPVDGLGSTGGFKLQIQDRGGAGLGALEGTVANVAEKGNAQPGLVGLFSTFSANQPQLFVDVDRVKAQKQGVDLQVVYDTLQAYLGSAYVNDITLYNRNWQVNVQAGDRFRMRPSNVGQLQVRNAKGEMVPLSTMISIKEMSGPAIVNHYNLYPSAEINGATRPGTSSGQAIELMDELTRQNLPQSMGASWTELSFQQIEAGKDLLTKLIFPLAVVFVFMVLAFQYEDWSLPMSILLIVPMCLLAAIFGVWVAGLDNNIFVQIGLVVLVGLAAKNAILIVEFAKQREAEGLTLPDATVDACRQRLRPILMTSFAFILGVVPLMVAKGAGSEMRVGLGVAVFSGMLGVTFFGLFFTPVFYSVIRKFGQKAPAPPEEAVEDVPIRVTKKGEPADPTAIQTDPAAHHPS